MCSICEVKAPFVNIATEKGKNLVHPVHVVQRKTHMPHLKRVANSRKIRDPTEKLPQNLRPTAASHTLTHLTQPITYIYTHDQSVIIRDELRTYLRKCVRPALNSEYPLGMLLPGRNVTKFLFSDRDGYLRMRPGGFTMPPHRFND